MHPLRLRLRQRIELQQWHRMRTRLRQGASLRDDAGAATAEYAVTILAAVGFAGVLVALLKGDEVKAILSELVHRALSGG